MASAAPRSIRLAELLADVDDARLQSGSPESPVTGISNDTRRLQPGDVFVAIPGLERNALDFVPEAIARGASAIVAETGDIALDVPLVVVSSARRALADLASAFYGHPSRALRVVGVTGTDGKTSTTHLVSAILDAAGVSSGWLTTVNTRIGPRVYPNAADHTTPEAPLVQRALADMRAAGVDVAIVETSSHALELERVRGVRFEVGVFTNLSAEHLNFHGTFEAYRATKSRLFGLLPPTGLAVLNADDASSPAMRAASHAPVLTYGLERSADLTAHDLRLSADGTAFRVREAATNREAHVHTRLVGRFNVANWLAAYGAAAHFGASLDDLVRAATHQAPIPGRMNLVRAGQPFAVAVDFAHTPHALENALDTARGLVPGRVLLVFGLAGGRDFHNRPIMGALAARKADFFVVSQDDPGFEDPAEIARQVVEGARATGATAFDVELDRRAAIRLVLARARPGDVVLLAGKGHEERMVVDGEKLAWNDTRVARDELERLGWNQAVP